MMRAVVLLLLAALPATAQAADIPTNVQTHLIARILTFDRNLKTRMQGATDVVIALFYKSGDAGSQQTCDQLSSDLTGYAAQNNINGMQVKVVEFAYDAGFEAKAAAAHAVVLYSCPGLEDKGTVDAISTSTRKHSWLSFAMREPAVRAGLSVGLVVDDGKPTILVNLDASRKEGADLDSQLLRVAKLLK